MILPGSHLGEMKIYVEFLLVFVNRKFIDVVSCYFFLPWLCKNIFLKFFFLCFHHMLANSIHKQPPRGVPRKRCSRNMQQIYRRAPMLKLQSNFTKITLRHGFSLVNLLHIFRIPFLNTFSSVNNVKIFFLSLFCGFITCWLTQ